MKRTMLAVLCAFALLLPLVPLAADETGYPGLYRYKLDNGLELYVYRDNSLPIARVEICFRAGAMAQTPDTAGLFHLYEHLVFGGDASNGGSAGVKAALATIGAAEWNGGTSAERVDYWLTLPSSKVTEGLEFWADRLRPADFSAEDLEAAKSVVSAEVRAYEATPEAIYQAAMDKRLFAKYPWRRDPAGTDAAIKAATPEAMAAIDAQKRLPELNRLGRDQTSYFCGSYFRYGFHEDAFGSAVALCRDLTKALVDWFPGHATHLDSALAHWLSKQRFGGKPVVIRRRILSSAESH